LIEIGLAQTYRARCQQQVDDWRAFGWLIGESRTSGGGCNAGNIDIVFYREGDAEERQALDRRGIGRRPRIEIARPVSCRNVARAPDPQRGIVPFGDARQYPIDQLRRRNCRLR
jgi:hypothetical protein